MKWISYEVDSICGCRRYRPSCVPTFWIRLIVRKVIFARASGSEADLCLSILKIEVIMMVLIDRSSRDLSNGCHNVVFSFWSIYLTLFWNSGCKTEFGRALWKLDLFLARSIDSKSSNQADCAPNRRARRELSKTPLIAIIGPLKDKIILLARPLSPCLAWASVQNVIKKAKSGTTVTS